jgi:hypothetical protein
MNICRKAAASFLVLTSILFLTSCGIDKDSNVTTGGTTSGYDEGNWYEAYETTVSGETVSSSDTSTGAQSLTGGNESTAVNNSSAGTTIAAALKDTTVFASTTNFVQTTQQNTTSAPGGQITHITLQDGNISISGSGAIAIGSVLTINNNGDYMITGGLTNGQIIVDALKTDSIRIALNDVHVSCSYSAPVHIKSADKVTLTLVSGTSNSFTDRASSGASLPNACVYSSEDITINGEGSLAVESGNAYVSGIFSKNDLRMTNGTVIVNAGYEGLKGTDSVQIYGGNLTVKAGNDGIKASNSSDAGQGFVIIEGGTVKVTSNDDAVSGVSSVQIKGGNMLLISGAAGDGIKALNTTGTLGYIAITGGLLYINAGDDLLNAAEKNIVSGCTIYTKYGGKRTKSNDANEDANIDYTCFKTWNGVFNGWN